MKVMKDQDNEKLLPKLRTRKYFYTPLSFTLKFISMIFISAVVGKEFCNK